MRLHIGKRFVYPHNNIESFEKQLERATKMAQESGGEYWLLLKAFMEWPVTLESSKKLRIQKEIQFQIAG